jgi:hypothetical protein
MALPTPPEAIEKQTSIVLTAYCSMQNKLKRLLKTTGGAKKKWLNTGVLVRTGFTF